MALDECQAREHQYLAHLLDCHFVPVNCLQIHNQIIGERQVDCLLPFCPELSMMTDGNGGEANPAQFLVYLIQCFTNNN